MRIRRTEALHVYPLQAMLGEGPVWDSRSRCLWCVDIMGPVLHRFDPAMSECQSWEAPAKIGWVVPNGSNELLAGLAGGIYRFIPRTGEFELIMPVEQDRPGNRINDGTAAPDGICWFGTMDDAETLATGRFYSFDGTRVTDCGIAPMAITNGPAVSPDGRTLYTVDTLAGEIWAYPVGDGGLGKGERFAVVDPRDGYPDGVACDAQGGVWLGLWGGWCARRYDCRGAITDEVSFPVANVTKIALGGLDGRTAFATTARKGLSAQALADQPLAGDIFSFSVKIPGVLCPVGRQISRPWLEPASASNGRTSGWPSK